MSVDTTLLTDTNPSEGHLMTETFIVLFASLIAAVATYLNHQGTKATATKEACVITGLISAIFSVIGTSVALDNDMAWNNWLTTSVVVVTACTVVHYAASRTSGRHAA